MWNWSLARRGGPFCKVRTHERGSQGLQQRLGKEAGQGDGGGGDQAVSKGGPPRAPQMDGLTSLGSTTALVLVPPPERGRPWTPVGGWG